MVRQCWQRSHGENYSIFPSWNLEKSEEITFTFHWWRTWMKCFPSSCKCKCCFEWMLFWANVVLSKYCSGQILFWANVVLSKCSFEQVLLIGLNQSLNLTKTNLTPNPPLTPNPHLTTNPNPENNFVSALSCQIPLKLSGYLPKHLPTWSMMSKIALSFKDPVRNPQRLASPQFRPDHAIKIKLGIYMTWLIQNLTKIKL